MRWKDRPVIFTYTAAFAYSWLVWGTVILLQVSFSLPGPLGVSIGGAGPLVSVILCMVLVFNSRERRAFLSSLVDIKRLKPLSLGIALLLPLAIIAGGNLLSGDPVLSLDGATMDKGIAYALFLLFFGPLPEEMAWRGICFEFLSRKSIVKAQGIVSLLWAFWHIPLFFIEGSWQQGLLVSPVVTGLFFLNLLSSSFIYGYLYLSSRRCLLIAVLFHYAVNLTGELCMQSEQAQIFSAVLLFLAGVGAFYASITIPAGKRA
jgi:uncharacterized protein